MALNKNKRIDAVTYDHLMQLIVSLHHDKKICFYDHAEVDNYFKNIYAMLGFSKLRNNADTINISKFTDCIEFLINNEFDWNLVWIGTISVLLIIVRSNIIFTLRFVSHMLCIPVWNDDKISYLAFPLGQRMWQKEESKLELAS